MTSNPSTSDIIRQWLREAMLGDRPDIELSDTTPLGSSGLLDSLDTMEAVLFLEERFGVKVPNDLISIENFDTISSMTAMIDRLSATSETPDS